MSEFRRVDHAQFSPTQCVACGGHTGPFIDLEQNLPVYGHLYLCASTSARSGCVNQIARLDDMIERAEYRALEARIAELEADIDLLVETLKGEKLVKLNDILPLVSARA